MSNGNPSDGFLANAMPVLFKTFYFSMILPIAFGWWK